MGLKGVLKLMNSHCMLPNCSMIFVSGISLAIPAKLARESRLGETHLETHRQGFSQTISLIQAPA